MRQLPFEDLAALGQLQCRERGLGGSQLRLQLLGQEGVEVGLRPPVHGGIGRRRPGELLGERMAELEQRHSARVTGPRQAGAGLADPVEQPPDGVLARIQHLGVAQRDAQRRCLKPRQHGHEGRRHLRVGEDAVEQPREQFDDLPLCRRSRARDQRGAVQVQALDEDLRALARRGAGRRQVAQQLVQPRQCVLELGAGRVRRVAWRGRCAHRHRRVADADLKAHRPATRHAGEQARHRAGLRRIGRRRRRTAAGDRARRHQHGAVDAGLDALRLESRASCRPGLPQQAGRHAGRDAQQGRAMRRHRAGGAGRLPERGRVDEWAKRV